MKHEKSAAAFLEEHGLPVDAARLTGVSESTIRHWINVGLLPVIKWHAVRQVVRVSDVVSLRDNPPARGRPVKKIKT